MHILIDECFPKRMCLELRLLGHDVAWAREICPGQSDVDVLALATREGRIVVTEDRDFGDLTMRDGKPSAGVVIAHAARFSGDLAVVVTGLCAVIDKLGSGLQGHLTVIEPGRVRQRALPEAP